MGKAKLLRRSLWANAIFAELGALAAIFFHEKWVAIHDLANGQGMAFGIELLAVAGLATYAALQRNPSKLLLIGVISANAFLCIYFLSRLFDASISAMGAELIIFEALGALALLIFQAIGLQTHTSKQLNELASY